MRGAFVAAAMYLYPYAASAQNLSAESHADFQKAVDDYQIFVTPHCAPDDVRAYVAARRDRDRAFVRSLANTGLKADYQQAVAERAAKDARTVYECAGPPPPPGSPPPDPEQLRLGHDRSLSAHFEAGDRQFARMIQLRDALVGSPGR